MYNNPNFFYYNNPANYGYMNYSGISGKTGLFSKLRGIKWGDLLNNTSKTLNVINQAIPIVYQVKPLITNAKTMFRIANIIKSDDKKNNESLSYMQKKEESNQNYSSNQPTFFL